MQDLESPLTATAPLYLHLSVTDPDTVAALSEATEGRDRQELALTALKIGAQFSLDNPASGLTRIVQRLEAFERAQAARRPSARASSRRASPRWSSGWRCAATEQVGRLRGGAAAA